MRVAFASLVVLTASACLNNTPPPAAPDRLDENVKWFWDNSPTATDDELVVGANKLQVAGKADSFTQALKSQMARLEKTDLTVVGLQDQNDPSLARGLLVVNEYACTLDKLQKILEAQAQDTLYTGVYDSYDREFSNDQAAFAADTAATLDWNITLKASLPVNDSYTSHLKGGLRAVTPTSAQGSTTGRFIVARTVLPAPAEFGSGSTSYFKQDYQIEIFFEQTPGTIFHAYGMWREMKVGGFNLTTEDNGLINIVLDNLVKWDDTTVDLCKKM
jgi:hypothetical protein